MAKITVHLHGILATRTGVNAPSCEVNVSVPATLRRVFELIAERHGTKFLDTLVDSSTGELQPYLQVAVNGQSVKGLKGLDTEVDSRDHILIHIFAAMRGGWN